MEEEKKENNIEKELEGQVISLKFGSDKNPEKTANRVSYIHAGIPFAEKSIGKAVLLDKTELNKGIETGIWYDCFVKREMPTVVFVRVIGKTFKNRLIITPTRTAVLVLQNSDNDGVERKFFHTPGAAFDYAVSHRIVDFDVLVRNEDENWIQEQKEW